MEEIDVIDMYDMSTKLLVKREMIETTLGLGKDFF